MDSASITEIVQQQLGLAQRASGRSAHTLHGGRDHALRQTVVVILAGHELAEHESPGEATLQVLHGRVRLNSAHESWEGSAGDYVVIPPERHALAALDDAAVLLTVVSPR